MSLRGRHRLAGAVLAFVGMVSAGWVVAAPPSALARDVAVPVAGLQPGEVEEVVFVAEGLAPKAVAVSPGGAVRWVNADTVAHNTTHLPPAGQPSQWNSYELKPGAVFTHTFQALGTYRYFDFYDPDNPDLQGVVIVTSGEVPYTPTAEPTSTRGPTPTRLPPTSTPQPTPTPSPAPVRIIGRLETYVGPCTADAAIRSCASGFVVPVSAGYDLTPYQGLDVEVDGIPSSCPATGETVVLVSTIRSAPEGCGPPPPTPTPTATPVYTENLARGGPVRASDEVPGFEARRLTDGDPGTMWYSAAQSAWAYVDLGADRTFNQVALRWNSPFAVRYGLYVWRAGPQQWEGVYWNDQGRGDGGTGEPETVSLSPTYGRYVLLYAVASSNGSHGYSLGELEVYGRDRPNLALGAAVVASAGQTCCPPWLAVDGNSATGWASPRGAANPWLRLHLPGKTDITELRLYWDHFAFPTAYSLVFYDGSYGRQLIVPDAPPGLNRFDFSGFPMAADTVLVYGHYLSPLAFVALSEAELYGPRLVVLDAPPGGQRSPAGGGSPSAGPGRDTKTGLPVPRAYDDEGRPLTALRWADGALSPDGVPVAP